MLLLRIIWDTVIRKQESSDPQSLKKAREWYEIAAKAGIKEAYNNLGSLYIQGKGAEKQRRKAFEHFKNAANLGDSNAQINLAIMYSWGTENPKDKMKTYEYLKEAQKSGNSAADKYIVMLCKENPWVCEKEETKD